MRAWLAMFGAFGMAVAFLAGCGASGEASGDEASAPSAGSSSGGPVDEPGGSGLSQGGAQDFGLFRQILEAGDIPGPNTIDDMGFFAEHKLDYPEPACGEDVCMHGLLGVMGNMITGSTCTLVQIGLNTPIDPGNLARPSLHLVVAVDVSGSMSGAPIEYVKMGLLEMIGHLQNGDRVSLVTYADTATVRLEAVDAAQIKTLETAFSALAAGGSTNLYEGLFEAFALADAHHDPAWQNRVIVLSDGVATAGLQSPIKMKALAEGYAKKGIGITTIGVGTDFDVDVMRDLSEVGAGNFYFLEDPAAIEEVFADEVETFLFPVALDVDIDVALGHAYEIRGAYGTNGWQSTPGGGDIGIPSLFLAGRTSSEDPIEEGRRGGGGAILLELVPRADLSGVADPMNVGNLSLSWKHPSTGLVIEQEVVIDAPHAAGAPPSEGFFSDKTVEKGFVMLNLYAAFELAAELSAGGDFWTARRTLEALRPNVAAWLDETPDPDIEDDLRYVDMFVENLNALVSPPTTPPAPAEPWPND